MIFFDTIILGFFYFLDSIFYRNSKDKTFGSREHALLFSWLSHSLYLFMLCDFVGMLLFKTNANDIVAYGLLTVLIIGSYVIYISRGRLEQLVLTSRTVKHKLLFVGIAFLYLALAVYLYFITSVHLKQV